MKVERTFGIPGHDARAIALSADGSVVACGSTDGEVRILALPSGKQRTVKRDTKKGIDALALSDDGGVLVAGGMDGSLRAYSATGKRICQVRVGGWTRAVALAADGTVAVAVDDDGSVCAVDVRSGQKRWRAKGHDAAATAAAISPDGRFAASAGGMKTQVVLWDLASGARAHVFGGVLGYAGRALSFSHDSTRLDYAAASGNGGRDVRFAAWDVATKKKLLDVVAPKVHEGLAEVIAFACDGQRAISSRPADRICLWEVGKRKPAARLVQDHYWGHLAVAITRDGARAVAAPFPEGEELSLLTITAQRGGRKGRSTRG